MAISKPMRLALRALSYPANINLEKTYPVQRAIGGLRTPLAPFYHLWDHKIERDGRDIRVRIYSPKKQRDNRLLLFFHGGGWVLENVDTYDRVCKTLAKQTGCRVASVEYALAPENPYPIGVLDCYAAAREVYRDPAQFGVTSQEITLIGDSAGGNLAAVVSLMARDRGEFCVSRQILLYPATYHDHSQTSPFASVHQYGDGYLLTSKRICNFMKLYAGGDPTAMRQTYFAPLLADDLSDQPETLVLTAQYDPLCDEGCAYAEALADAGNRVEYHCIRDALHGFFSLSPRYCVVRRAYGYINRFLNGERQS